MRITKKIKRFPLITDFYSQTKESLFKKVLTSFVIIFMSFFLTLFVFYSYQQIYSIKSSFVKEGKILVDVLSTNSRLGIMAGNKNLLEQEAIGFLNQPYVVGISIFSKDSILVTMTKTKHKHILQRIASIPQVKSRIAQGENPPYIYETDRIMEIWKPVYVSVGFKNAEELVLGIMPTKTKLSGWVALSLDKSEILKKERLYLLYFLITLFVCISLAYFFMHRAAIKTVGSIDMLCRYVERFKNIEEIEALQEIPMEGEDEAGRVAKLINQMIRTLKKWDKEKKKLETQLLNAQKLEAIGALAGGIAHDFNNVLASVMGSGEIVNYRISQGKEVDQKFVDAIIACSKRAKEVIVELLKYARGNSMDRYPLKLNDQIVMLKKMASGFLNDDIEVKLELSEEDPVVISNSTQLHQVLLNMLTNAQDAMPKGGKLRIATGTAEISEDVAKSKGEWVNPGKYGVIYVEDTGIGMDKEVMKRIFDPFFTTKGPEKGTGLGLYNCFNIIKEHGGFIDVESEKGKGTLFKIYIPLSDSKEVVTEEKEESLSDIPKGSGTILVADDDPFVREVIKAILNEFGYEVILASNGIDVIKKFKDNIDKIDLVLMDIVMPYKHGKSAQDELRKIKPDVKILLMSGYPDYVLAEKSISVDEIEYLQKPIRAATLLKKIQQSLESKL